MADINREYLLEQFQLAEEYLRRVKGLAHRSREDYLGDPYAVDASIRELTVLFETVHNIAKHLIARHGWRAPLSKAEAFEILAEQGILSRFLYCGGFVGSLASSSFLRAASMLSSSGMCS
jgi:uncharacterized protein YutE (UPF0331/DUF86 family)